MKINTFYKTASIILLIFLTVGCNNDMNMDLPADALVPVQIADAGICADIQTRAQIEAGVIGVMRTSTNNYTEQYDGQYTYSSGWHPTIPVLVGGNYATLCAYYPYGAVKFNNNTTQCTLEAQKYSADKDLSYAITGGTEVCNKSPQVNFRMKHGYARLRLSIIRATDYLDNCNISIVNLKSNSSPDKGPIFLSKCSLDIRNGSYSYRTDDETKNGWNYNLNTGNIAPNATNEAYDVLIPPQEIGNNGFIITLTIDGKQRSHTINAADFAGSIKAGQKYSLKMTIHDTSIQVGGGVNIFDMTDIPTDITNEIPQGF